MTFLFDSKYGFTFQSNMLHISLLLSVTAPDTEQDQDYSNKGKHEFSWAVKDTSASRVFLGVGTKRHARLLKMLITF